MPKIHGLLDDFPSLESITPQNLTPTLGVLLDPRLVDNSIGNWILFSHIVPETLSEYKFQLAFLIEAIKTNAQSFYHPTLKRIYIPEALCSRVPNLNDLVWVFIKALAPTDINVLILRQNSQRLRVIGTYIRPNINQSSSSINIEIDHKKYELAIGKTLTVPTTSRKADVMFFGKGATLLGRLEVNAEISGGAVGIIVDASIKE